MRGCLIVMILIGFCCMFPPAIMVAFPLLLVAALFAPRS
jgi:hypothetical protein